MSGCEIRSCQHWPDPRRFWPPTLWIVIFLADGVYSQVQRSPTGRFYIGGTVMGGG